MSVIRAALSTKLGHFDLDVAFEIPGNGVTGLFGRSGSGKTSVLRWMAGLMKGPKGSLVINEETWEDSNRGLFLQPHLRSVGYIFQENNLFPHLTVRKNLQFALKRVPKYEQASDLELMAEMLGISRLLELEAHQLSGGERQRVAIARSLLMKPKVLLLDEPLAALDTASKFEIIPFLERIKKETRIPILLVSHSLDEVKRLCDHIIHIENGRIQESGSVSEVLPKLNSMQIFPEGKKSPKAISFVGHSGAGKTTLIESLIPLLKSRGYKVGAIKHDAHDFEIDHAGKDSYRLTQAGADSMLISSSNKLALIAMLKNPIDAETLIAQFFANFDIVLVEGHKVSALPKIIVTRAKTDGNIFERVRGEVLAIATDAKIETTSPVIDINDPIEVATFLENWMKNGNSSD